MRPKMLFKFLCHESHYAAAAAILPDKASAFPFRAFSVVYHTAAIFANALHQKAKWCITSCMMQKAIAFARKKLNFRRIQFMHMVGITP